MLVATVTKKSVSYVQPKLNSVSLNLSIEEDGKVVLTKDYSYLLPDDDFTSKRSVSVAEEMQKDIDAFKKSQVILKEQIDPVVTTIQGQLKV